MFPDEAWIPAMNIRLTPPVAVGHRAIALPPRDNWGVGVPDPAQGAASRYETRALAPVNLRDELRETEAEAGEGDKHWPVPQYAGGFRSVSQMGGNAGRDRPRRTAARFVSCWLVRGQI